ncbi:gamma-glutamyl-gamma-aminobutyrate hydrolase family protein [Fluviibacterium sp. S390]|uniref:gamma-glutamyl-gamma-aminobutyrate hydrolase family protein n=1 Tax=Fluviibacterium sp. S390 TaxID=3415139 RepID=UPI003C7C6043
MSRPVIGVSVSRRSGWRIFPLVALNVLLTGGRARRWSRSEDVDLNAVDGVIIGGGDDISPDLYQGELVTTARLDPYRDALEREIVESARARNLPILGICRGAQMLNVALGGSLDQDAYGTFRNSRKLRTILPRKRVRVLDDTRLCQIMATAEVSVNALHSQSVKDLGRDLRVSARDNGGMVQAVETTRDPFAIGVQWHPEHLFYLRRQRALFAALVAAARARREHRAQIPAVDEDLSLNSG